MDIILELLAVALFFTLFILGSVLLAFILFVIGHYFNKRK